MTALRTELASKNAYLAAAREQQHETANLLRIAQEELAQLRAQQAAQPRVGAPNSTGAARRRRHRVQQAVLHQSNYYDAAYF